ncbi:lipoxygenase 3, chloroplastic-like isoform X1 [Arachis ipaensis]|uniref:Lipoxygenase n=1 Tax=Arachis hypogaea TaxID=3818 RepID=A0A445AIS0_ARAHY|nr:lipoxygenase 3, chloroplastic-like isoform X1 [Arachis ipaensis]RYR26284.1 hypothetical protein Ahy_B02g060500 [Arachis hypogaea]
MRMVKEILGQSVVVEAFCFDASRRCHTHQNNNKKHKISMFPSFSCSSILLPIVKRRTTFDDLISSNKSLHDGGGVTLTISASVTIKNSKEFMAMMLHYFDSFSHNTTGGDRGIIMQLVSTQIDPTTMEGKLSKRAVLDWTRELLFNGGGDSERSTHKVEFEIDSNFGFPGAITVTNKYDKEIFLETISIEGGFVEFSCNSWVQPEKVHPDKRIFFTNKACLPCDTAEGVKELRKEELRQKRGDGNGMRKVMSDRVYDYDVYNDLGNLDKGIQHVRPILGTKQHPNPRRCRTGRPPVITNEKYESCVNAFMETYVPRDEVFEGVRKEALDVERVKGVTRNLIPFIRTYITKCGVFKELLEIKNIYKRRHQVDAMNHTNEENGTLSIDVNKLFQDSFEEYFKFSTPHIISGNGGCCITDEELGRQALAGVNPLSIKRLQTFPPVSDLDPSMYGPQESALKAEHIISHLDGMSVQQAIVEKKLFILDYHDAYMPFLKGINAQEDRKAYATRTILYLTRMGTLKPIAIELSLPEGEHQQQQSKQVLTPPLDATSYWLWQLAKAHVCSNDAGVHQLVHHCVRLRTHACMEPFIIAAHRQMSVTHPIFKLLKPHMKYTLQINALARKALINGGGIIESDFSTGRYSTEIVSAAYKDWWRFDMEALPADLIRRGLAEPDRAQPLGIKLTIEDYPYANDGLLIWFALERMVRTYVNYYYHNGLMVRSDTELQGWYNEVINVGHGDHAHATWWPTLATPRDLISVLTTLIWIASVQHSAVNFGQYPLGGYVPMRPPLVKKLLPKEGDPEYKEFLEDPEGFLCSSLPNMFQTTKFLAVLNILSQHPEDEEYIGQRRDLSDWIGDPKIIEAFYDFSIELKRIEKEIEKRNKDQILRNRCGAGIPPYELLIASSGPGVTCRGVPNSIST